MLQQIQKRLLLVTLYVTSIFSTLGFSQGVVCRLPRVEGFDNEYATGHTVCGETTDKMNNTKLYVTVKNDYLYVQSNYITPGFDNPTKLATTDQMNSIDEIAMNIFFAEYPTETEIFQMNTMLNNSIEVIIDPQVLNSSKYSSISFDKVGKVKFLCPDNEVRDAVKIKKGNGEFDFGIKYNNQVSTRIKDQNLNFIFLNLRSQKVDFKNLKVVNLVDNNATKEVLTSKFAGKHIQFDFSSKENFKKILLSNKGSRTVILGHIENGEFVTLDKSGNEIFRISISEIQTFQKENKLELILLGCNSASEGASSGALNKFNSVDALNRLETAKETQNVEEFLDSLSMGTIHFLVDETFFRIEQDVALMEGAATPERIDISIYEKPRGEIKSINTSSVKGNIIFLGLGTAEYAASEIIVATDTTNANPVSQDNDVMGDDNPDKPRGSNHMLLYILIGVVAIGVIGYFIKSSNKS
jgi:hypothetical protein